MPVREMASFTRIDRSRRARRQQEDSWWSEEQEEEYVPVDLWEDDDCNERADGEPYSIFYYARKERERRERTWPTPRVARPSIASLVKFNAPIPSKPKPPSDRVLKDHAENEAAMKKAAEAVAEAEAKLKAKQDELAKNTAENSSINKWSNRATREAVTTRLKKEVVEFDEMRKVAVKAFEKIVQEGQLVRSLVAAHAKSVEGFAKYVKAKHAYWECIYGEHTPLKTETQLFSRYDVVGREKGDVFYKLTLKEGTDMDHLTRELEMGGHETIRCEENTLWLKKDILEVV